MTKTKKSFVLTVPILYTILFTLYIGIYIYFNYYEFKLFKNKEILNHSRGIMTFFATLAITSIIFTLIMFARTAKINNVKMFWSIYLGIFVSYLLLSMLFWFSVFFLIVKNLLQFNGSDFYEVMTEIYKNPTFSKLNFYAGTITLNIILGMLVVISWIFYSMVMKNRKKMENESRFATTEDTYKNRMENPNLFK
ncbi:hypothetical protein MHSN_00260 [Metamycoplasma hyosynoviae]|uniref:Uncharacterized protein n=5 Tax=Metamycoplasma hyosynoviae TaxID=29559 RepID=A0A4P1QFP7_9BACT|nr:hypothetical protein MHSN_00260 [Metamycoplasma hyosynoviae]